MAGEGAVIACHTVDEWNQQIQLSKESKKLVNFQITRSLSPFTIVEYLFAFWICPNLELVPFVYLLVLCVIAFV